MKKLLLFSLSLITISSSAQLITATGSLSVQRTGHESQLLSNGKVLVFGGNNGNVSSYVVHSSAQLYSAGSWTNTGSMMKPREYPGTALLSNGNVLAIGGRDNNLNMLKSCEIYNVAAGTWSYTDSLANARYETRAVTLNNGDILAVAGNTNTCELYNQSTNTWSATGSLNIGRSGGFAIAKLPNGDVLLAGGQSDTAEIYSASSGTWSKVMNGMTYARDYCTAILMSNNKVLIAGGNFTLTSEVYDPVSNSFTAAGNLINYCSGNEMVNLANGKVLIYGIGNAFNPSDKQALQVYDPAGNNWYSAGIVGTSIVTAKDYTVNKISSGTILYAGGIWTTGNGANTQCYLVNESAIAANSIEENADMHFFNAYPNPMMDELTINAEFKTEMQVKMELKNILGQPVKILEEGKVSAHYTKTIDVTGLISGFYFLNIITENGNNTVKLFKE